MASKLKDKKSIESCFDDEFCFSFKHEEIGPSRCISINISKLKPRFPEDKSHIEEMLKLLSFAETAELSVKNYARDPRLKLRLELLKGPKAMIISPDTKNAWYETTSLLPEEYIDSIY